jgi:hypothetical protein
MCAYLVINAEGLIRVFHQLMDGKGGIVWLDNGIRDLGGRNDGEGGHHSVGEFFADLGDQKRAHAGTGTTTEGVGDLEALEAVAALGLATNNVKNLIDKFGTLGVMALGPIVSSTGLAENEVVGTEELTEWAGTDGIHGTGLEIDKDGTRNILVVGSLVDLSEVAIARVGLIFCSVYLVEVDAHSLELEVGGAIVAVMSKSAKGRCGLVYTKNTYTPDPSRPCSPEMVCLWWWWC